MILFFSFVCVIICVNWEDYIIGSLWKNDQYCREEKGKRDIIDAGPTKKKELWEGYAEETKI